MSARGRTTVLFQTKTVKMLVQLHLGAGVKESGSGSVFSPCQKRKKCFIAVTRDPLKKVLDANYSTNCRRVRNVQMCCSSK